MIIFVVHYYEHYDDYKRADSSGDVINVFVNEDEAYKCAVDNFLEMFKSFKYIEWDGYDIISDSNNILYHTLTHKEKYKIIKDNLFSRILPGPEYTSQPTHINYSVKAFEI